MAQTIKIAIVQANRDPCDCKLNTEKGISIILDAKELGADIVLFPECWITGYEFPNVDRKLPIEEIVKFPEYQEWKEKVLEDDSEYIKAFCSLAGQLQIGVVITGYTKGKDRPQNTAFVIDKNGKIIMKYSKVHTCDFGLEKMLESGNEFKVCDFNGVRLGVMICYDREYPESARVLMMKGAEIILVPNDCSAMPARVQTLYTRAYENMLGVVMANPPGENAGNSCAFSPIVWDENGIPVDNKIVLADDKTEKIYIAEYDLDALRKYRYRDMMGNTFRKVDAYSELMSTRIDEPFIRRK
jgi:predicted amidohydrolase